MARRVCEVFGDKEVTKVHVDWGVYVVERRRKLSLVAFINTPLIIKTGYITNTDYN